ncbi:hypothetical protein [Falsirhodobacter sp. 1013]|uniref:hypothetical protein n=1 Tax=Falsirhodobacter sp. 1013 TaxID=3417566 RepID=UPI003EC12CEC
MALFFLGLYLLIMAARGLALAYQGGPSGPCGPVFLSCPDEIGPGDLGHPDVHQPAGGLLLVRGLPCRHHFLDGLKIGFDGWGSVPRLASLIALTALFWKRVRPVIPGIGKPVFFGVTVALPVIMFLMIIIPITWPPTLHLRLRGRGCGTSGRALQPRDGHVGQPERRRHA